MKKFFNVTTAVFMLTFALVTMSCKKKSAGQNQNQEPQELKTSHSWYYFNQDGFAKTTSPWDSPSLGDLPYTEAVRISSANSTSDKAYALVNRLGMLCFADDDISLAKDVSVFADRTAGNLVFMNDVPVFSVYKSSYFNDSISSAEYKKDTANHLFLIQFDSQSRISYPLINSSNLTTDSSFEVTDFYWDSSVWYCCLKGLDSAKQKTVFSYIQFEPSVPLLSITPVSAKEQLTVKESTVESFRSVMRVKDYSLAPERIRKMLRGFASDIPFTLEVKSESGFSSRVYENIPAQPKEKELNAKAIISQSWSAALFEDGTLYIEGALKGKHILRGGKAVAIRLPKLKEGFIYSDFVISGTTLYAAWEETDFYKIRRSGFLSVDLDSTLYSIIR